MRTRRIGRSEREARRRARRRVLFVCATLSLLVGVHYLVDGLTRNGPADGNGKAAAFVEGGTTVLLPAGADPSAPATAGMLPAGPASPGTPALDPAMRQKAAELQKRYADRLSRMSTQEKMRALNKASKLIGQDVRGFAGR